jgi:hypothetical protein
MFCFKKQSVLPLLNYICDSQACNAAPKFRSNNKCEAVKVTDYLISEIYHKRQNLSFLLGVLKSNDIKDLLGSCPSFYQLLECGNATDTPNLILIQQTTGPQLKKWFRL